MSLRVALACRARAIEVSSVIRSWLRAFLARLLLGSSGVSF
jgi:hypothetical protein